MLKIILNGYRGKLGNAICERIKFVKGIEISAGIDIVPTTTSVPFPTYTKLEKCEMPGDVLIDTSIADVVPQSIKYAVKHKMPLLVCTTGLSSETIAMLEDASKTIPVFRSANMSLGVNLVANLLEKAYKILEDSGYDIEIFEKHHNAKLDAPSGTALMLADVINEASGGKYEYVYDRASVRQKRDKKELGIHSLRGGNIVGEHTVFFAGEDEVIEIKHTATSKQVFATGALKAAKFLATQKPGMYNMNNIMDDGETE